MLRIFKRLRASRSMTDDMHNGQGDSTMNGKSMTVHGSMTEGSSMEEMSMMHDEPMMDDMPNRQGHPGMGESAFACPACGANFGTRAEQEEHGQSAH